MTNKPSLVNKILNFITGLSDFHNCVSVQLKCLVNMHQHQTQKLRSFKNFDQSNFLRDLIQVDFSDVIRNEDVNISYVNFSNKF